VLDRERPVSKESDVYSFSMVVIEAFTGQAPYHDSPPTTAAVGVLRGNRPGRPTDPSVTDDLWEMIKRCWNREPERRPEISQVVLSLRTASLRRGHVNADDATLLNFPPKKGFWFSRHRARQSSTQSSPEKGGVSPVSTRAEDRPVASTNSPNQRTRCHYRRSFNH